MYFFRCPITCETARHCAAMHVGQDDEEEVFHHNFQFHPPPALALTVYNQVQTSSTPFSGPQFITVLRVRLRDAKVTQ